MPARTQAVRAVLVDMFVGIFLFGAMSMLAWHAAEQIVRWDLVPAGIAWARQVGGYGG